MNPMNENRIISSKRERIQPDRTPGVVQVVQAVSNKPVEGETAKPGECPPVSTPRDCQK